MLTSVLLLVPYGPDPLKDCERERKVTFRTPRSPIKLHSFTLRHVRVCRKSERAAQRSYVGLHGPTLLLFAHHSALTSFSCLSCSELASLQRSFFSVKTPIMQVFCDLMHLAEGVYTPNSLVALICLLSSFILCKRFVCPHASLGIHTLRRSLWLDFAR